MSTQLSAPLSAPSRTPLKTSAGLALSLTNVVKKFDNREVIKNLDLHIQSGDFIAIVGHSGCGKSTLLRLLAQLETASSGELTAMSIANQAMSPQAWRQSMRLMFQDDRLLPWKTVLENVGLGLKTPDWKAQALKALAEVGLAERADDWPSALSGGQKQRVALARAIIHRPQLLLLDEPLGALDALTRLDMQQLLVKLWQEHRFTVILVTHDVSEAVITADRVILIEQGKIGLDLPILLPHPRNNMTKTAPLEQIVLDKILAVH